MKYSNNISEVNIMFQVDNKAIGDYISKLINSKFYSSRDFCRRWLALNNEDVNECAIRNKANKLSQIYKGSKGIQTYDLPVFSELLGVSFEQILSAGKSGIAANTPRMTNYYIAHSQSKKEWQEYIDRSDTPILYKDEFGLNTIEYAIQFQNYDFIKFLMDNGYIWFDSRKDSDYVMTFGAGTSIKKINFEDLGNGLFIRKPDMDDLQYMLATEDQLRLHIIVLACNNNDLDMLNELRAREIPELYYRIHCLSSPLNFDANYHEKIVAHIAQSSAEILEYFTDAFEINDKIKYTNGNGLIHTFIFPFISQLLDFLISYDSPFTNRALEKMIQYNSSVYNTLDRLIKNSDAHENSSKKELHFNDKENIVNFQDILTDTWFITNIANATEKSNDCGTNVLIDELCRTYNQIKDLGR